MKYRRLNGNPVRRGFTLLEMLVVMWALGVALFLGTALILTTLKASKTGETASARVGRRDELARTFRDDVARAEAAPDKLGDLAAGPARLLLRMPGGAAVIYRWENNTLERVERAGPGGIESRRAIPIGPEGTTVEFVRPTGPSGVVTLRVAEPSGAGPAKRAELSAALGGNMR